MGDGALRNNLQEYIKENEIPDVYFTGFVNQEDISRFYAISDIFVLPSIFESWGLAVNEVMCFGIPVIVSDKVGCGPDLVKSGENGYIFKSGSYEELAKYLKILLLDEERRKSFGDKSLEIISKYNYEVCVEGILKALSYVKNK